MNLRQLVHPECVILELESDEPDDVIREMVAHLAKIERIAQEDCDRFSNAVIDREAQIGTGLGSGVAVPHARVEGPEEMLAVFARSKNGSARKRPAETSTHRAA
ncbi:PTS sugar transporter subunit IIA [Akkermansiaceae bacterium]|nr:PTS sugar transporter subunit IIA [Akkermansiaceae bacterium]